MEYSTLIQSAVSGTWAAAPDIVLGWYQSLIHPVIIDDAMETDQIQNQKWITSPGNYRKEGGIAILPIHGIILPRDQRPGVTSAEWLRKTFIELIDDTSVRSIILDIDSYGGQIGGIPETSDAIYQSRGKKKIIALAHFVMDAAAYWIGSAADEVIISPSGEAGGIGIVAVHNDSSKQLENKGLKLTLISAGKYKLDGNPWEPLTEGARDHIQEDVRRVYELFIEHVARNRGIAPSVVRDGFGQGRVVSAEKAVQLRMADRVATFDETINRLHAQTTSQIEQKKQTSSNSKRQVLTPDQAIEAENLHKRVQAILAKKPVIRKTY